MPVPNVSAAPMSLNALDLVGVGVGVETFGNHSEGPNLWQAVQHSRGQYLISQEKAAYPRSFIQAAKRSVQRTSHALESALMHFMDSYPLPLLAVGAAANIPDNDASRQAARAALAGSFVTPAEGCAMTAPGVFTQCPDLRFQRGQLLQTYLNNRPDLMWDILFHTLETHTDAPLIGLAAHDGIVARAGHLFEPDRAAFDALFASAVRPKFSRVLSDSCTVLTLAHRARTDALRPFATSGHMYDGMQTVTRQQRPWRTSASCFDGWRPGAPQRPATPYLQQSWTAFQMKQFDNLPHLGTVYRPQMASYWGEGDQLVEGAERQARFDIAVQATLAPLNGQPPARVFYDYGGVHNMRAGNAQFRWLSSALKALHPDFDLYAPHIGVDLAQCLGELGAGSPFVAVALASMAGMQSGGATLIANLRRKEGASLMLVQPPSDEQRQRDAAVVRPFQPQFNSK